MWMPHQHHVAYVGRQVSATLVTCGCHISTMCRHVGHQITPRGSHVSAMLVAMLAPRQCNVICHVAAMSAPHQHHIIRHASTTSSPHHLTCQQPPHFYKWCGELIHDDHIRHRFWAWAGLGFTAIYDDLRTSWITLIYDENVGSSRRLICNAQYMTFWNIVIDVILSMTKIDRHGPQDIL
jgi:hypothetical protein